ncbi:L-threo-3-deoxy-hexylosonate aldolase [Colletotrichum sp. SAR 10_86]|nr:L-threo-3-deoxy-hexylosonate aldolase [Colletotrichum sp. SAR 10_86]
MLGRLVILPAYYAASLSTDQEQIIQYYVDICKGSPIPLFLYNFPANSAGLDMSSAIIEAVIRQAPNLCGVKLTEPSVNSCRPYPFLFLDGLISDLTPWMKCGGHGTVSGIPNFAPAASMRLWALLNKPDLTDDEKREAERIQSILSNADVAAVPAGVRGMICLAQTPRIWNGSQTPTA